MNGVLLCLENVPPKFLCPPEHKLISLGGGDFGENMGLHEVMRPGPMMSLVASSEERDLNKRSTLALSLYILLPCIKVFIRSQANTSISLQDPVPLILSVINYAVSGVLL